MSRKYAAAIAAAVATGALIAPGVASADGHGHGHGGHHPKPIPPWDAPIPDNDHGHGHSWGVKLPESHKSDILDLDKHSNLPDLSHLPDFKDFHHHYKKEKKTEIVYVEKVYPKEPIQYPPQAPTDSLAPRENWNDVVPLGLSALAILGVAGVAVRRASAR